MHFISKTEIVKMAEHVFRRSHGVPDKRLMHPRREWIIGLLLFLTIVFAGGVLSVGMFSQYQNLDTDAGETIIEVPQYNSALVTNVIDTYKDRTEAYDSLINIHSAAPLSTTTAEAGDAETMGDTEMEIEKNVSEEIQEPSAAEVRGEEETKAGDGGEVGNES